MADRAEIEWRISQWSCFGVLAMALITSACGGENGPIFVNPDPTSARACENTGKVVETTGNFATLPLGASDRIRMVEVVTEDGCTGWQSRP